MIQRIGILSVILSAGVALSAPVPEQLRAELCRAVRDYYAAVSTGEWAAVEATLHLPDELTRELRRKEHQGVFQVMRQEIRGLEIRSVRVAADGESAMVRAKVTGTATRFDGEDRIEIERVFAGLVVSTGGRWKVLRMMPAEQVDARRERADQWRELQRMGHEAQSDWLAGHDPLVAKQFRLAVSMRIRLTSPVAGVVEHALPAGTPLAAGDVIASVQRPGHGERLAEAAEALEETGAALLDGEQAVRQAKAATASLEALRKAVAEDRKRMDEELGRQLSGMVMSPLPGTLAAWMADPGGTVESGGHLAGTVAAIPGRVLGFCRISEDERGLLDKAGVEPEECVYAVRVESEPVLTLVAEPVAVLEDSASDDVDIVLALDAGLLGPEHSGVPAGVGIFLPDEEDLRNAPLPDERRGPGAILGLEELTPDSLATHKAAMVAGTWRGSESMELARRPDNPDPVPNPVPDPAPTVVPDPPEPDPVVGPAIPAPPAEPGRKVVSAEIVGDSEEWEGIGKVRVTYDDGSWAMMPGRPNCSQPKVAADGTIGWVLVSETPADINASYKLRPDRMLVLCRQGKFVAKLKCGQPFIRDWKFAKLGEQVVIEGGFAHGASTLQLLDIASGKTLQEVVDDGNKPLPDWAKALWAP